MTKHMYFHSSNFDYTKDLPKNNDFFAPHQYEQSEFRKLHQYEYGKIRIPGLHLHLILGNPPQENCPWCGHEAIIKHIPKIIKDCPMGPQTPEKYCVQCVNCGSRGPILNVNIDPSQKEIFDECMDLLKKRYNQRRPWDSGFINHYEEKNEQ